MNINEYPSTQPIFVPQFEIESSFYDDESAVITFCLHDDSDDTGCHESVEICSVLVNGVDHTNELIEEAERDVWQHIESERGAW